MTGGRKQISLTLGGALQGRSCHTYVPGTLRNAMHQNSALTLSKVGKKRIWMWLLKYYCLFAEQLLFDDRLGIEEVCI